ncbi:hypothetical protein PR048_015937 [Dryococelus australis]|uniref:Uncharacterized protein n=1 Tax=Dryococelus australis TaxID=614101 RepID=A0ABQ9HIP9_9NEOP|nr:hypothetical protein PR048_015937 [Dryococelus australis]
MTSDQKPVLPPDPVQLLVRYCMEMEERYFGLTVADVKRMPFELPIRNYLSHHFNARKKSCAEEMVKIINEKATVRASESIVIPNSETFVGPVKVSSLTTLKFSQERSFRSEEPQPSTTNLELSCPTSEKPEQKYPRAGKADLITSSPYRQQ